MNSDTSPQELAPDVLLSFDALTRRDAGSLEYASRLEKGKSTNVDGVVSRQLSPVRTRKLDGEYEAKRGGTFFPVQNALCIGNRVQNR